MGFKCLEYENGAGGGIRTHTYQRRLRFYGPIPFLVGVTGVAGKWANHWGFYPPSLWNPSGDRFLNIAGVPVAIACTYSIARLGTFCQAELDSSISWLLCTAAIASSTASC